MGPSGFVCMYGWLYLKLRGSTGLGSEVLLHIHWELVLGRGSIVSAGQYRFRV